MKKVLSLLLIVVLSLFFVSCEKQGKEATDDTPLTQSELFDQRLAALSAKEKETVTVNDTSLLAPAQNSENLWGYINLQGEWVVAPEYMTASCYSEGYAMVLDQYYEYILIDKTGTKALSNVDRHSLKEVGFFSEGIIALSLDITSNQKYVYLNTNFAKAFTAWDFPEARYYSNYNYFGFASVFHNGLAVAMRLKNADISDKKGPESACVITTTGAIVAKLPEGLDPDSFGFDDQGNVLVKSTSAQYGLCDINGNLVLDTAYKRIMHCQGPLYLTCNDSGFWGFIKENGEVAIDYLYQKAYPFSDGLAAVYDGNAWGFINESGEVVIDFIFDDVHPLNDSCTSSSLNKAAFNEGIAAVKRNNHWILINKDAEPIFSLNMVLYTDGYDECPFDSMSNGYISFAVEYSNGSNFGLINKAGKIVIKDGFTSIGHFK